MLLAYDAYRGFILFQMDVKSAFLNGFIFKEVCIKQPPGLKMKTFLTMSLSFQKSYMV